MNNINKVVKITQKTSLLLIITIMVFGLWTGIASATLSITTSNPSNITHSSVILNGVLNEGSLSITAWFELGTNPNNLTLSTSPKYYNSLSDDYNSPVSGLNSNTIYYFRTVAQNSQGRVYGNILSFKTSYAQYYDINTNNQSYYGNQPSITTNPATSINGNSAIMNGFVNGNNLPTTAWFEWGTNTNFANSTTQNYYGNNVSRYNITLTGLIPNTVYHFRAVAQNGKGRVFGNTVSFTTGFVSYINYTNQAISSELRTTTNLATNISSTKAQLNGLITNQGIISSNTYFEWGTNYNLINKTQIISTGSFPIVRHINKLTGLTPNTTYYFRIIADNGFSRSIGTTTYFTTSSAIIKTDNTKTKEITNTATVTPVNSGEQIENNLSASIINANFLPGNLFDWLLLIIFILTLILLTQHMFPPVVSKQEDNEQY